jgi:(2Fe-2S) ferredoxin
VLPRYLSLQLFVYPRGVWYTRDDRYTAHQFTEQR